MPNSKPSSNNKLLSFKLTKKTPCDYFYLTILILVTVGLMLLIYISFGFTSLYYEELNFPPVFLLTKKTALELSSSQSEYQIGDIINVKTLLKTDLNKTQGVDIFVKYDPETLALLTVDSQREDLFGDSEEQEARLDPQKYLDIKNSPFDIFPYFSVQKEENVISFSALAKPLQQIGGDVEIAVLNFQALKKGETSLEFVFEKGKTNETNVAFLGRDILKKVTNLQIIIN